ncbi:MAG: hypothetical protein EBQ85_03770 [Proteobacteria bacterium]|nr:hypothetical protein [Pseudomonadota bacterium]
MKPRDFISVCFLIGLGCSAGFSSEPPVFSLPEITIEPSEFELRDPAQRGEVPGARLEWQGMSLRDYLDSHLAQVPGVQIPLRSMSASPQFLMRGMDSSETRVFVEGIPLTEPGFNSYSTTGLPSLAVNGLEVFSGAVPGAMLSDGLSGAVNLKLFSDNTQRTFLGSLGSFGFVQASALTPLTSGLGVSLEFCKSDENFKYLDQNGTPFNLADDLVRTREHNAFKRASILPKWKWKDDKGNQVLLFSLNSIQQLEIPGSVEKPDYLNLDEFRNVSAVKGCYQLSKNVQLEADAHVRIHKDILKPSAGEIHRAEEERESDSTTAGGKASLSFLSRNLTGNLAAGVSWSKYQLGEKEKKLSVDTIEIPMVLGAVIHPVDSLEIAPVVFAQKSELLSDKSVSAGWLTAPRLGIVVTVKPYWRMRTLIGKYFRQPTLTERNGNLSGLEPNQLIMPESAEKGEIGVDWSIYPEGWIREEKVSYTLFVAIAENLISWVQNGPDTKRAENIGKSKWLGHELLFQMKSVTGWSLTPSLQWLSTENLSQFSSENGKQLPGRFPWVVRIQSDLEQNRWHLGYSFQWMSSSFLDKVNYQALDSFSIHDLFFAFETKNSGRFRLDLKNVFDLTLAKANWGGVEVGEPISGMSGYPSSGRRVNVTWTYDF